MPVDYRRISGPENTLQYFLYSKQKKTYEECEKEMMSSLNLRKDGRKSQDVRKIYVKSGVVSQAKGSAYIEMRNTKVICSVFDPREIPNKSEFSVNGELYCEFKFAPFSCKRRRGFVRDGEEKELSVSLRRALEPAVCRHEFPNYQVDVYVLVLQNDGSALAAAINCAGLALADASVPMYDLVSAASIAIHGNLRLMDPTVEEENVCGTVIPQDSTDRGLITLAYLGNLNQVKNGTINIPIRDLITLAYLGNLKQVTETCQSGKMDCDCVTEIIETLEKQAMLVYPVIQQCLVTSVQKHNKEKSVRPSENVI